MNYFLIAALSFLIGSVPFAYIVLKYLHGKDITREGSGNVGALNAYETSHSRMSGLIVLLLDLLKGIAVVLIAKILFPGQFLFCSAALTASVLGHCYTPWLKFKGGRGLATAAGGLIIFIPHLVVLWLIFWYISYLLSKNVHIANSAALVLLALVCFIGKEILSKFSFPAPETPMYYGLFIIVLFSIIMSRHVSPLMEYFKGKEKIHERQTL